MTPAGERFSDIAEIQESLKPNTGLHPDCDTKHFALPPTCRTAPDPEIVLWGDSYAMHLAPALVASETQLDFTQITKSSCGPFPGLSVDIGKTRWQHCTDFNDNALDYIAGNDTVNTVILSSAILQVQNPTYDRDGSILPAEDVPAQLMYNLIGTQRYLAGHGKTTVIVSPPPQTGRSLGLCYLRHRVLGIPPEDCDFERDAQSERNEIIANILRSVERDMPVIWFDDFVCDDEICHTSIDQISIYRDSGHLSVPGSTELGRRVDLMGVVQQEVSGPR